MLSSAHYVPDDSVVSLAPIDTFLLSAGSHVLCESRFHISAVCFGLSFDCSFPSILSHSELSELES
jgi:hypothetical protein